MPSATRKFLGNGRGGNLLDIALEVHSIKNGSLEIYEENKVLASDLDILNHAIANWEPSIVPQYARFYCGVCELI